MEKWINVDDGKPEEDQDVFYYFDLLGVFAGKYTKTEYPEEIAGATDIFGDTFYGDSGWLTDDATHWMPRCEGDENPQPPKAS